MYSIRAAARGSRVSDCLGGTSDLQLKSVVRKSLISRMQIMPEILAVSPFHRALHSLLMRADCSGQTHIGP